MKDMGSELQLFTIAEAADRLRLGKTTLYALLQSGELRSITIGKARRIPASAIAQFLSEREAEAAY